MATYALSQNEGQVNFNPNTDLLDIDTTSSSNLFVTQITGNVFTDGFAGPAVRIQDEFGDNITLIGVTERQLSRLQLGLWRRWRRSHLGPCIRAVQSVRQRRQ